MLKRCKDVVARHARNAWMKTVCRALGCCIAAIGKPIEFQGRAFGCRAFRNPPRALRRLAQSTPGLMLFSAGQAPKVRRIWHVLRALIVLCLEILAISAWPSHDYRWQSKLQDSWFWLLCLLDSQAAPCTQDAVAEQYV
ncbi:unnamed protein product [Polarella glacialis]|uniref:Uncharacterized protein n=1 Tax=Polarella glacialis TaxID=89957 RepID=A0A813F0N5_POLGL|nr:unnamed protein product [Polarella glacialis]CAE8612851.1 unnamed protein product [Polarella glacialis]